MATIRIVLDERHQKQDLSYPLKLRVNHNRKSSYWSLNIFLNKEDWNEQKQTVNKRHPNCKQVNQLIKSCHLKVEQLILKLEYEQQEFTSKDITDTLKGKSAKSKKKLPPDFFTYGYKLVDRMKQAGKIGNARAYRNTLKRLESYLGKKKLDFTKITYDWLEEFEACFLSEGIKVNTISFYLRTIRAIYNRAIKAKIANRADYPFHDYSIKKEATVKRAISKEKIKLIENKELKEGSPIWHNRNYFILAFNLIGISFIDLCFLKWENVQKGRVIYTRRKTGKIYNIKLTAKASNILIYYKAHHQGTFILPIIPEHIVGDKEKEQFYSRQGYKQCNKYIGKVCRLCEIEEKVTTYVARHSWATIAKKLGYSKDLIAEALGHEYGNRVTGIYLDNYDLEVIDEMNERVCS